MSMTSSRSWTGDQLVGSRITETQCGCMCGIRVSRQTRFVWRHVDVQAFRYACSILVWKFIQSCCVLASIISPVSLNHLVFPS